MAPRSTIGIREVGPREALQAHAEMLPTDKKIELIDSLLAAGVTKLNAVSLVSPRAMPHMADAEDVLTGLGPRPGVTMSALVPNDRGMARAEALAMRGLLGQAFLLHAATAAVLRANGLPASLDDNLARVASLAHRAKAAGMTTGVFVSAAFGCSMEGQVPPAIVLDTARKLADNSDVDEIVISDSTGQADPYQVQRLLTEIATCTNGKPVTVHLHDSRGAGLANAVAAIASPIEDLTLDTSFGGLGGDIPFIPEAAGNISTEDLVAMLDGMNVTSGIDCDALCAAARRYREWTGVPLRSRLPDVGPVRWKAAHVAG
jgi:hydroxymethylglutaryl-CoA lyase